MTIRSFTKMHGLGNDFVVLDARVAPIHLSSDQARAIADRRTGIGCDQIITLKRNFCNSNFSLLETASS